MEAQSAADRSADLPWVQLLRRREDFRQHSLLCEITEVAPALFRRFVLGKLRDQLHKRSAQLEKSIAGKASRLTSADYIARAPAAQVEETRQMQAKEQAEVDTIRETLDGL